MGNFKSQCEKEIDLLIRARYPLLYIVSYEEERVSNLLSKLANERNKQFFIWTTTCGIHKFEELSRPEQPLKVDEQTRDPLNILNHIERQPYPAIFLLKDFHPFLSDHTVVRKLRDLVENLKQTYETIVILSPILNVPVELEKDIVVVDFELPNKEDLNQLLNEIIEVVSKSGEVKINLDSETREKLISAALGLTLTEAENAFARSIVVDKSLGPEDVEKILAEKEQVIRKSGILEYYHPAEKLEDIGGLNSLKDWLIKRSVGFTEKAKEFGLPEPKGILLIGVQGCGKSLTAKAISSFWKLPLLRFDVGRVFSGIVGSSEENMRKAIRIAESVAPVILWIDEIEKSLSGVQSSGFSDAGTSARVFSTFLTWLQEKKKPVFVVSTANNISLLPPELLRKGRFDEIFFVDLPNFEERKEIFSIHLKKRKRDPKNYDLEILARESEGYSGAEIEQAVISALFDAFVEKRDINTEDILRNLKSSIPLSQTMREDIQALRDWARTRARPASLPEKEVLRTKERKIEL
ncbi:MAG: AAA family ATPase [Candidatus Omnitrophica bacterium]|nr:AAA family ATPase [Candidatus Omnitrophota bacterium]